MILNTIHIGTALAALIAAIFWLISGEFGVAAWTCCINIFLAITIAACRMGIGEEFFGLLAFWAWFE